MTGAYSKKRPSNQIFSHGNDSTDSDFIQSHIDSFFLQADSREMIDEYRESRSDYRIDYVVDLVDDALDMLVAGFAYVRDLVQTLGEMIVEWGMRVIDAIGEAFSAVRDAVSEVGEMVSALAEWIEDKVSGLFSSVWDTVISGLESWAEGIQEAMEDFFQELAEWDEMDGSESMEDTMEAGSALMLSFIGQQDRASSVMDVIERIMRFIEPFQEYLSPFGAIRFLGEIIPGEMGEGLEGIYDKIIGGISEGFGWLLNNLFGADGLLDLVDFYSWFPSQPEEIPNISTSGIKNFTEEAGLYHGMVKTLIDSFDEINFSGIEKHWASTILLGLSSFAIITTVMGGITQNPFTSLLAEGLSLLLTVVSAFMGEIAWAIVSFVFTYFNGIASMVLSSGEPIMAGISFAQMWLAILPMTTL